MTEIVSILNQMPTISLDEMSAVKLMNRVDTKYVFNKSLLPDLLADMLGSYYVQEIGGKLLAGYKSLYYDTEDCVTYLQHHDKKLSRQKLRTRCYIQSGMFFCEVKTKSNKGRTKKKRIEIDKSGYDNIFLNPDTVEFVKQYLRFDVNTFIPQLENNFERITLVNNGKTERLTIDMNIRFRNRVTGEAVCIPDLVILELKQDGRFASPGKSVLFDHRVKLMGMSKYCIGTMLTNPHVKGNRFKKKIRIMRKLNISIIKNQYDDEKFI